ncbi:MAG: ATP-binding protein [Bacteroidota bacterium]|nr:ATP-binding protein [Bacteroidota bacterium]
MKIKNSYKDLKVNLELQIDPNLQFSTDKELLIIILKNLIDNSIKYSDEGKKEAFIKIKINEKNENLISITIEDNGEGIDEMISDKVYDIFYRGSIKSKGSGLGLFITRKAVEKLEGEIQFKSVPHKSTIFTITLKMNIFSKIN